MWTNPGLLGVIQLSALMVLGGLCRSPAAEVVLAEWGFDRDGDLQGWQPNAHLADVQVAGGALTCRGAGADPILELKPLIDVPATAWQAIEIRLKADRDGIAEFFWSNTTQTRYGGFAQEKSTHFSVAGDGQWHTYRLFPFWPPEGRIIRLRFDPYDGAQFALDWLRIVQLAVPPLAEPAEFDFTQGAHGWQGLSGAAVTTTKDGLQIALPPAPASLANGLPAQSEGWALGPPLRVNAAERSFVSLCLAVDKGGYATVLFASEQAHGAQSCAFPLRPDGQAHTYCVDMLAAAPWRGRIVALGLRPSDAPGARATLRWLKVSAAPQGPPELWVVWFALDETRAGVGTPATLRAAVANEGGTTASNLVATLKLPDGVRVVESSPPGARAGALGFGEELALSWRLEAARPLRGQAELWLSAPNAKSAFARAPVAFARRSAFTPAKYVPEPKPVRGRLEVGVYYFPGWRTASQWQPIQPFPERKPLLGWYEEGRPEVADWHIKWAVEHGITFFAYDWYWSQGARQLEHALHDGYFKARYRHLLKFCLLWANHNPPGTSAHADCLAVTRYWISNYFRLPEHLAIEGKPAVIIFSPDRLTADLGSEGVKQAFEAMRAECRHAGLKGLYLVACVGAPGQARQAAAEGYDAVTAYNWPGLGMNAEARFGPYETLIEGYRRQWLHLLEPASIPLLLPINGGWDSRPWHGLNNLVRYGRTPELFRQHLRDAKALCESQGQKSGIKNVVLIEAWNEWGEGSYIEPHREFEFGYLDAIREVFTDAPKEHVDLAPAEAGLGPYDVPPLPPTRTAWEFTHDTEGWDNVMGLTDARAQDGALHGRSTGNDPAFFGPPMQARASEFSKARLRLKLGRADGQPFKDTAQLFWRTNRLPEGEAASARFEVAGDGQWHDYEIPLAANPRWRGLVTRLRLDPCTQRDVEVSVDYVELAK
jgi:hypothetical protein